MILTMTIMLCRREAVGVRCRVRRFVLFGGDGDGAADVGRRSIPFGAALQQPPFAAQSHADGRQNQT